jgi:hypothetical protein
MSISFEAGSGIMRIKISGFFAGKSGEMSYRRVIVRLRGTMDV